MIEVKGHKLEKGKYDYSSEYGVKVQAECLIANIAPVEEVKTINTYIYNCRA